MAEQWLREQKHGSTSLLFKTPSRSDLIKVFPASISKLSDASLKTNLSGSAALDRACDRFRFLLVSNRHFLAFHINGLTCRIDDNKCSSIQPSSDFNPRPFILFFSIFLFQSATSSLIPHLSLSSSAFTLTSTSGSNLTFFSPGSSFTSAACCPIIPMITILRVSSMCLSASK